MMHIKKGGGIIGTVIGTIVLALILIIIIPIPWEKITAAAVIFLTQIAVGIGTVFALIFTTIQFMAYTKQRQKPQVGKLLKNFLVPTFVSIKDESNINSPIDNLCLPIDNRYYWFGEEVKKLMSVEISLFFEKYLEGREKKKMLALIDSHDKKLKDLESAITELMKYFNQYYMETMLPKYKEKIDNFCKECGYKREEQARRGIFQCMFQGVISSSHHEYGKILRDEVKNSKELEEKFNSQKEAQENLVKAINDLKNYIKKIQERLINEYMLDEISAEGELTMYHFDFRPDNRGGISLKLSEIMRVLQA